MYGSNIWSIPTNSCSIYINNIPENIDVKAFIPETLDGAFNRSIGITTLKRIGRKCDDNPRPILCVLTNTTDKYDILYRQNVFDTSVVHSNPEKTIYESLHSSFCKFVLNVNKFSSNTACLGELGRFPLHIKAWTQAITYWLRLVSGTKNTLFNEAFVQANKDNHWWVQGVKDILIKYGRANVANNSAQVTRHKRFASDFQQRLKQDYIQRWFTKISNSESFKYLKIVKNEYCMSPYLTNIQNTKIRKIITKLRINNSRNLG